MRWTLKKFKETISTRSPYGVRFIITSTRRNTNEWASLTCISQLACCCVEGHDERNSPDVRYSLSVLRLRRRRMMSKVQVLRFLTIIKRAMSYTMISTCLPPTSYYWSDSEGMEECDKQSCYYFMATSPTKSTRRSHALLWRGPYVLRHYQAYGMYGKRDGNEVERIGSWYIQINTVVWFLRFPTTRSTTDRRLRYCNLSSTGESRGFYAYYQA